jgi:hypothetical protein
LALLSLFAARKLKWNAGVLDGLLGPTDALGAIVGSGTRNAWAISAVVKPPTARNVNAIAEAGVNAGWQHMSRRSRVSSS